MDTTTPAVSKPLRYAYPAALTLLGITIWLSAAIPSGMLSSTLYETYDAAGNTLQVLLGGDGTTYLAAHHSNTGVRHPGPLFIMLTYLGDLAHTQAGLAASSLGAQLLLLSGVKAAAIVGAGALIGAALRSRTAAIAFLIGTLLLSGLGPWNPSPYAWRYWDLIDMTGRGLQAATASMAALLIAAGLAWARQPVKYSPVLAVAGGACLHVHASTALLGATAIGAALATTWRNRRTDSRRWYATACIAAAFLLPLAIRALIERGWPLTYVTAAESRLTMREAGQTLEGTGGILDALGNSLGIPSAIAGLLALAAVCSGLALLTKASTRRAGAVTLILGAYTILLALVGGAGHSTATELMWLGGIGLILAGGIPAAVTALAVRKMPAKTDATIAIALTPLAVASALIAVPEPLANTAGPQGDYIPQATQVVQKAIPSGKQMQWQLTDTWLETTAGILLQLTRDNVPYCVRDSAPPNNMLENPNWFFPPDHQCQGDPTIYLSATENPATADADACLVYAYEPSAQNQQQNGDFPVYVYLHGQTNCPSPTLNKS